ncbi:MAG TPA: glycosyltransferase [Caldithrix sp.]|nr:glycosyltransferase [Caldithrix sp.]
MVHENHQKEYLIETYQINKKIHVIPHGVRKVNKVKNAKEKLNLSENKVVLLAGYFRTTKHFEKLLHIFPEILKKYQKVTLLIACRLRILEHNELRDQLLKSFKYSEANGQIKILRGQFPQYTFDTIMSAADVVVLPYSAGAQSGMLAQFSAFKIPTVTSDLLSFKLWNESSKGGLSSFSDLDYINNILKIISDDELAQKMRDNISKNNEQRYWDVISKKHLKIYQNIVETNKEISEFYYIPEN